MGCLGVIRSEKTSLAVGRLAGVTPLPKTNANQQSNRWDALESSDRKKPDLRSDDSQASHRFLKQMPSQQPNRRDALESSDRKNAIILLRICIRCYTHIRGL